MDDEAPGALPSTQNDPFLGREVAGKYRILERLGAGGMGAVYKARHLETGGDVALKVLHGTALGEESAQRRFRLEAQNAAALRHVNTIRVLDFGVDAGLFYLVLEYLAGRPLSEVLIDEGPLDWPRAVHITRQVLKALWEAHEHERRIIHRDIKPANIFLSDLPGERDHVKVLDFGISRALEGTGASGANTRGIIGTPFYMAPELWRGEPIDARTDLYALGCVVFQMLAGHPPFVPPPSATESLYPLLAMHLHEPPPPLASVAPGVPAPICAWVDALLAKEPGARPPSAREALSRLDAAAATAMATPPTGGKPDPALQDTAEAPRSPAASTLPTPRPPAATTKKGAASPVPLWLWLAMGALTLAALVAVIALQVAGEDTPAAGPQQAPIDAPPPPAFDPQYGALQFHYRARLSAMDRLGPDGSPLYAPAAILARDRVRFHGGVGDPEDGADPVAHERAVQATLESVFDQHLDTKTRLALLEGSPLVEVAVYEDGLRVRVLSP